MKKRAAMLLAGMIVLSLAVPCAAGAEETNDSEYYYVNGKAPEEVTGNILFWSWDPNFFDMVQKMEYPVLEKGICFLPFWQYAQWPQ